MRGLLLLPLALLLAGCATPTAAPTSAPCDTVSLELSVREQASSYDLIATNDSDRACSITGYPGVTVLTTNGEPITQAPMPMDAPPPVELGPGDAAYALIEIDRGQVDCDSADTGGLEIQVPGIDGTLVVDRTPVLFCFSGDEGDQIRAGSFRAEPLEGQDIKPSD